MKVLVLGGTAPDSFSSHIVETLRAMGHSPVLHDYIPRFRPWSIADRAREILLDLRKVSPRLSRALARRVASACERSGPFDLVLSVYDYLTPAEVRDVRKAARAPVVLWFPDAVLNIGRGYFIGNDYDAVFLKDPYMVRLFRDMTGLRAHYLPECFNPERHRAPSLTAEDEERFGCDVATAANLYMFRAEVFRQLSDYRVRIWGSPPPPWVDLRNLAGAVTGQYVVNEAKAKALLAAKIVVNTHHPSEIWGTNVRTFEVAGSGAFLLCEYRPAIPFLFEEGREIVTFRSAAELREKVSWYLARDEERKAIAERGRRRAESEHTYRHRLETLLRCALEGGDGHPMPEIKAWTGSVP